MSGEPAPADPPWLVWARELQAMAQTGLTFSKDPYDRERYRRLRALSLEMLSAGSGTALPRLERLFEQDVGYPTPKVDVRGAVIRGNEILLVREASDGRWTLPGGWADISTPPSENVEREIREESGYEARARRLVAVWDSNRHNRAYPHPYTIYKMFFLCELVGGEAATSLETSAVAFFAADALPELSLGRVNPHQIARLFEHARQADLPADFD